MGAYDFQLATADRIAEIFREATIASDGSERKQGGQRRVLLADEVGLGKTIIAREVVSRVREMRREVNDDMFRVVYVCSNMNIVRQNISNLGIKEKLDVVESRLSMQHLVIAKKDKELKAAANGGMSEMLIPLTPGTSFSQKGGGVGNMPERALIAVILSHILKENFADIKDFFKSRYVNSDSSSWNWYVDKYIREVNNMGDGYISNIIGKLVQYPEFPDIISQIDRIISTHEQWQPEHNVLISSLRRIFADLSLGMLEPDLIIMDEFQRFSSLLDYTDDSEQTAIVKKFFEQEGGQQPLILLLSATPYKPFSTLEELTEYNADEHYEDFNRLTDFLFNGFGEFKEIWTDYSHKLSHLKSEKFDILIASKERAEGKLYEAMCRTERLNEGLLKERCLELQIDENDILSFCEMQRIVENCKEASMRSTKQRFNWSNMPVEYIKSSPYLLSFMDTYELKRQIERIYSGGFKGLYHPSDITLLRQQDVEHFHRLSLRNARLQYLRDMMLPKGRDAELLLWVPASHPYYTTNANNPFVKNRDFSKALIFSAWEMVPRMIAVMMSYETEREVIFSKYKKANYRASTGSNRLKRDAQEILSFPSVYLASLYDPKDWFCKPVHIIRNSIKRQIEQRLSGIPTSERRNYAKILAALRWLDDRTMPRPEDLPSNTIDILTDMAIAAPGVCLYRILKDVESAKSCAEGFTRIFNRRIAGYIIDKLQEKYHSDELYLDGVMDYCVMGNLQAVIDEYAHLSGDAFVDNMENAFITEATYKIDTDQSFGTTKEDKYSMRASYAVPFSKGKTATDEKSEKRSNNIRVAFQSPFYPFIVASTSVGQEGLDFHWYCRKIVHWNLPSNPQDIEQREGRINRYKCLAIRRNLARMFSDKNSWDEIFSTASDAVKNQYGSKYTEMVPSWCLPTEWIQNHRDTIEWIERIVPQYPMSNDISRYRHLIDVLSLYRLTMGQPRQEELLEMLSEQHLTEDQISKLLFNFSPISRNDGE